MKNYLNYYFILSINLLLSHKCYSSDENHASCQLAPYCQKALEYADEVMPINKMIRSLPDEEKKAALYDALNKIRNEVCREIHVLLKRIVSLNPTCNLAVKRRLIWQMTYTLSPYLIRYGRCAEYTFICLLALDRIDKISERYDKYIGFVYQRDLINTNHAFIIFYPKDQKLNLKIKPDLSTLPFIFDALENEMYSGADWASHALGHKYALYNKIRLVVTTEGIDLIDRLDFIEIANYDLQQLEASTA